MIRALVLAIAVALAYSGPLSQLPSDLDRLGWLQLAAVLPVPVVLLWRGIRHGGEIEDHQVDLIVAFVLLGSALLIALDGRNSDAGPAQALVSLPLFTAGSVTLLYGVCGIWRVRLPLALSLLALSPLASGILDRAGSGKAELAVVLAVAGLGLLPLVWRPTLGVGPVRALMRPAIGSAPLVTTICLLLLTTAALAAMLWQGVRA